MVDASATSDEVLTPLLRAPHRTAILCDLDGTLSPIVGHPEDSAIPDSARVALARLADRYALVAIVSGRRASEARRIVGLGKLTYAGNHGLEVLYPNASQPTPLVDLGAADSAAPSFVDALEYGRLIGAGLRREEKGPIVALHWRNAPDERLAENVAEQIAAEGKGAGLRIHRGRKVIELRPEIDFDKGRAVASLLDSADARIAFYAGDDRTDLDAFAELVARRERSSLEAIVRVGVRSPEGPQEITAQADLVVAGPEGVVEVLRALSG